MFRVREKHVVNDTSNTETIETQGITLIHQRGPDSQNHDWYLTVHMIFVCNYYLFKLF